MPQISYRVVIFVIRKPYACGNKGREYGYAHIQMYILTYLCINFFSKRHIRVVNESCYFEKWCCWQQLMPATPVAATSDLLFYCVDIRFIVCMYCIKIWSNRRRIGYICYIVVVLISCPYTYMYTGYCVVVGI